MILIYKPFQVARRWDSKNLAQAGDLTHSVAVNNEMIMISKSMHLYPDAVLENTDLASRAFRKAIAFKDIALGSISISEFHVIAEAVDSQIIVHSPKP